MDKNIKTIILGFALMIMGGINLIIGIINTKADANFMLYLSYGFYLGFLLILIGLFAPRKVP
jgi:uncharacterized membrane protein HdeD (DUF308 family)